MSAEEASQRAEKFVKANGDTSEKLSEYGLNDPDILLAVCHRLDADIDTDPTTTRHASRVAYDFLESEGAGTAFLFDEREYYLGELALLAGTACRILALRDEARAWLDRASTWFLLTANACGDAARVEYQRLALKMEERQLLEVLRLSGPLSESFRRGNARELSLKCRYLRATALKESGRLAEALTTYAEILEDAKTIGSTKVVGPAYVALIQLHSELGQATEALNLVREAKPFLESTKNRVALPKLHWGVGLLMRTQKRPVEAIEAFRAAQAEFQELGMKADVAALHLVIADLLLEGGQERQAEWEIRAALPAIEELKMVPEGFAAMSLLRESLRRRSIDRQALRNLHGYFEEPSS